MTSQTGGEFRGKTVDDAIEAGLAALGLKEDQVTIEVLSRGSRGLLGFGAEDARVRLTATPRKPPTPPQPAEKPKATPAVEPPAPPTQPPAPPKATPAVEPPAPPTQPPAPPVQLPAPTTKPSPPPAAPTADSESPKKSAMEAAAVELLQGMLDRMDVAATVHVVEHRGVVEPGQDAPLMLNIEGEDLGVLIGRRGETLDAIQYLTRLMVNHRLHTWSNVVVDVEGYRARREEQLRKLAERMAERVEQTGRAVALEAMPARERRIIHLTLRSHPTVTTQSVGEGESRKVTIIPRE